MIRLTAVSVDGNRVQYEYTNDPKLDKYFNKETPFFIEYQDPGIDFSNVPNSILSVPFVTNLLPLAWMFDVTIEVDELDATFYQSIEQIKQGFEKIYPQVQFSGTVSVKKIVSNTYINSNNSVCLFSGGVDAMYTLLKHRKEHPTLINVWGVDISFDDIQGHTEVEQHNNKVAETFQCKYICVKSTLRSFLNEHLLNQEAYAILEDYWWHGTQHSIGLLSILAPYNYLMRTGVNYIASSFTEKEFQMGVKCVSYPVVDEALRFASTKMIHDGYESQRIDKIRYICSSFRKENRSLELKVCFHFEKGKNCSSCEKCYRTMMAILIFDPDLNRYGFHLTHKDARKIRWFLQRNQIGVFRWEPIRQAYIENDANKDIQWLKNFHFNETTSLKSRIHRAWAKVERLIDRILYRGLA